MKFGRRVTPQGGVVGTILGNENSSSYYHTTAPQLRQSSFTKRKVKIRTSNNKKKYTKLNSPSSSPSSSTSNTNNKTNNQYVDIKEEEQQQRNINAKELLLPTGKRESYIEHLTKANAEYITEQCKPILEILQRIKLKEQTKGKNFDIDIEEEEDNNNNNNNNKKIVTKEEELQRKNQRKWKSKNDEKEIRKYSMQIYEQLLQALIQTGKKNKALYLIKVIQGILRPIAQKRHFYHLSFWVLYQQNKQKKLQSLFRELVENNEATDLTYYHLMSIYAAYGRGDLLEILFEYYLKSDHSRINQLFFNLKQRSKSLLPPSLYSSSPHTSNADNNINNNNNNNDNNNENDNINRNDNNNINNNGNVSNGSEREMEKEKKKEEIEREITKMLGEMSRDQSMIINHLKSQKDKYKEKQINKEYLRGGEVEMLINLLIADYYLSSGQWLKLLDFYLTRVKNKYATYELNCRLLILFAVALPSSSFHEFVRYLESIQTPQLLPTMVDPYPSLFSSYSPSLSTYQLQFHNQECDDYNNIDGDDNNAGSNADGDDPKVIIDRINDLKDDNHHQKITKTEVTLNDIKFQFFKTNSSSHSRSSSSINQHHISGSGNNTKIGEVKEVEEEEMMMIEFGVGEGDQYLNKFSHSNRYQTREIMKDRRISYSSQLPYYGPITIPHTDISKSTANQLTLLSHIHQTFMKYSSIVAHLIPPSSSSPTSELKISHHDHPYLPHIAELQRSMKPIKLTRLSIENYQSIQNEIRLRYYISHRLHSDVNSLLLHLFQSSKLSDLSILSYF